MHRGSRAVTTLRLKGREWFLEQVGSSYLWSRVRASPRPPCGRERRTEILNFPLPLDELLGTPWQNWGDSRGTGPASLGQRVESDPRWSKQKLSGTCNIPGYESLPQKMKYNLYSPKRPHRVLRRVSELTMARSLIIAAPYLSWGLPFSTNSISICKRNKFTDEEPCSERLCHFSALVNSLLCKGQKPKSNCIQQTRKKSKWLT